MFKRKHPKLIVAICLLFVVILSGCSGKSLKKPLEFSENTGLTAKVEVTDTNISIIQDNIITNSEKLAITNRTLGHSITVYLFQDDDKSEAIMSFELDKDEKKKFTNLSSNHIYSLGVSVKNLNEKITVSCEITD